MDGMDMGTPWLGGPITLHAWREYECELNTTSQCEYQEGYWRFWYEADHRYAVPTVAFFTIAIILFAVGHLIDLFLPRAVWQKPFVRKTVALTRFFTYRAFRISALNWNSAPLGILSLAAVGIVFFFCMTLVPQPYYWPTDEYGGSPPIATRSGWLSIGCMPFVFATAGKSNFITALTGVSHEKLQVFHRWISYAFFVTALIHTFPFIIVNIRTGTMVEQWNTSVFYWTGVIALIAQGYLTFASMSPLRNLSYEWFKFSHFVAALVFMLFFFFHCDYTLSAWDYFIVTGVLFSLSWLHRQIRLYFEHGINHRASLELAPNGFIRMSVPTQARWHVGQHFFVRVLSLGIHASTIHPFTACSLPQERSNLESTQSELVFYIRPRSGFTARLARLAESRPQDSVRVLLDGPYGGVDMRKLQQNNRLLVIAGGSGAGWLLPVIAAYLRKEEHNAAGEKGGSTGTLKVILATRDIPTRLWFEQAVHEVLSGVSAKVRDSIQVELFFTGGTSAGEDDKANGQFLQRLPHPEEASETKPGLRSDESPSRSASSTLSLQQVDRRPDLASIIRSEATSAGSADQLGVFVCGPLSMQSDVQNAVAAQQMAILKGEAKNVYLHMEHFSWA